MKVFGFLALALVLAGQAIACGTLPPPAERAKNREDVERQEAMARELAVRADDIFLGKIIVVDNERGVVTVRVTKILKGDADQGDSEWKLPRSSVVISCSSADMFHQMNVHAGRRYFFYATKGTLLRAGWLQRGADDLSVRRESGIAKSVERQARSRR